MRATPTGDECCPGVGKKPRRGDLRRICDIHVFPAVPVIFDENDARVDLGRNGSTTIGDASHLA